MNFDKLNWNKLIGYLLYGVGVFFVYIGARDESAFYIGSAVLFVGLASSTFISQEIRELKVKK